MKYKYYFSVLECDRFLCNFIKACDLGIEEYGIRATVTFISDKKPTKKLTKQIEKLLEKSKEDKSLKLYFANVKFEKAEIIMEEKDEQ